MIKRFKALHKSIYTIATSLMTSAELMSSITSISDVSVKWYLRWADCRLEYRLISDWYLLSWIKIDLSAIFDMKEWLLIGR